ARLRFNPSVMSASRPARRSASMPASASGVGGATARAQIGAETRASKRKRRRGGMVTILDGGAGQLHGTGRTKANRMDRRSKRPMLPARPDQSKHPKNRAALVGQAPVLSRHQDKTDACPTSQRSARSPLRQRPSFRMLPATAR